MSVVPQLLDAQSGSISACCIWTEQTLYKREIKMRKEKRMNGSTAEKDVQRKRMSVLAGI